MSGDFADHMTTGAVAGWIEEMRSAYLYRVMAQVEEHAERARLFAKLAEEAESQARVWAERARANAEALPARFEPDRRTRLVARLIRGLGVRRMRSVLAAMKVRGLSIYRAVTPSERAVTPSERSWRSHRRLETHADSSSGGSLRAAVFGVSDGLSSNCSLILGLAGAGAEPRVVLLSGMAGLLAGAFSMAAGEYVSVRAQREMYEHQIGLERQELETYPNEEAEELALIYAARGMPEQDARGLATRTIADPERALDTLAREELGLNPEELGSPLGAALSSFASFAIGALVPILPFLIVPPAMALTGTITLTAAALFAVGALISLFTGRSAFHSALRMLLIGGGAGALTYVIGHVLAVTVS